MIDHLQGVLTRLGLAATICLCPVLSTAYLDLSQARVETLGNGLTVIILEEHSFPVVSVQMLYRTGARDESTGKTGLAHFVEHMAFRQSENFPDYGLVGAIDAVGGEWHGYTWLDQTTYFATVPADKLELLIRIEADRMSKVKIDAADIESERGSVLTELYGYENDPASVLHDNVLYLSFLAHPYRNNTIGWDSDVAHINHDDLLDFYARQYQPGNAVLAVVGDVNEDEVMQLVAQEFANIPGRESTLRPHTTEPVQNGERRIRILGAPGQKYFEIAYRAPSVHHPDFAAFLLTQDLLAGSSGINFLENDWGTPARHGSFLGDALDEIATWYPPSDQDYAFAIKGALPGQADESQAEAAIESGIERLRQMFSTDHENAPAELKEAVTRVDRALIFDIKTTEDAAHQLAFFAGIDALDVLVRLPEALQKVQAGDIARVLDTWLRPEQRTIGWFIPGQSSPKQPESEPVAQQLVSQDKDRNLISKPSNRAGLAMMSQLSNGTPVIMQRSTLSRTATLKVVMPAAEFALPDGAGETQPAVGLSSLDFELLPAELEPAIVKARESVASARPLSPPSGGDEASPDSLLERAFRESLGIRPLITEPAGPVLLVVTGDIDPASTSRILEQNFADLPTSQWSIPAATIPHVPADLEKQTGFPVAQEALGYVAQVPDPSAKKAVAWQMLLNIFINGYDGRLGVEAIGQRGLVYYIGSAYHTDGRNHWVTLSTGVDPGKHDVMKKLLREQLASLLAEPPSLQEIDEARAYLLGRYLSEAQSNTELADSLTWQWILFGKLLNYEEYEQLLNQVGREDIIEQLPAFSRGVVISVRNPKPGQAAIK